MLALTQDSVGNTMMRSTREREPRETLAPVVANIYKLASGGELRLANGAKGAWDS
jgi:hypothetical protein